MNSTEELKLIKGCPNGCVRAVMDTMNVLNGKWKLPIIASLLFAEKHFNELERGIPKISPRMFSK